MPVSMFVTVVFKGLGTVLNGNLGKLRCLVHSQRLVHDVAKLLHNVQAYVPSQKVDLSNQSVLLPGPERIRASRLVRDPTKHYEEVPGSPHIKTVFDCLDHGLKLSNDGDCAGTRTSSTDDYKWIKYSEARLRSQYLGSALINAGLKPSNESFVGVFASNRIEFFLMLFACAGYSMVLVPLYDSYGPDSINFIINQVNLPIVIANNSRNALHVLKGAEKFPLLKNLVLMETPTSEVATLAENAKIRLSTFSEFEEIGKLNKKDLVLPKPQDLFIVVYTSGTTGVPKGTMLTHSNITACLSSLIIGYGIAGSYGGTIISYLPPAHLYEIMNQVASLYFARRVAFYTGDVKKIFDEIRFLKPNIIPLVPRLMNAFYAKVYDELKAAKWKLYLFEFALWRKEKAIKKGIIAKKNIWDKLVFKKIQEALGGNAHIIVSTSAPVSVDVTRFFKCASGCYIFEAYGQTEAMAATFTLPHEWRGGHVGPPLPCTHVKMVDVPEMEYYAKNDEGEVCCKGPSVCKGYFKNPEATKELLTEDGWLRSGDIGKWLPNGTLKIIDRKKNLFKLSQGEYIAPEKVEMVYGRCPLVQQLYIDGLSDKDYVVAIVVPDEKLLDYWLWKHKIDIERYSFYNDKTARIALLRELRRLGAENNLNNLEQARSLALIREPFSVANELLTPTFKLRRNQARKHFKNVIEKLYKEGPLIESST